MGWIRLKSSLRIKVYGFKVQSLELKVKDFQLLVWDINPWL